MPLWRHVTTTSPATQSRWQWPWASDDAVCKKYGQQVGLVGPWGSGQPKRVRSGIAGLLLVGVIGDGPWGVPVDWARRRPDPVGAGAPCRAQRRWTRIRLDERRAALRRRGRMLPPPRVGGASWFSDSPLMQQVGQQQGTLLVEGKQSYGFP